MDDEPRAQNGVWWRPIRRDPVRGFFFPTKRAFADRSLPGFRSFPLVVVKEKSRGSAAAASNTMPLFAATSPFGEHLISACWLVFLRPGASFSSPPAPLFFRGVSPPRLPFFFKKLDHNAPCGPGKKAGPRDSQSTPPLCQTTMYLRPQVSSGT